MIENVETEACSTNATVVAAVGRQQGRLESQSSAQAGLAKPAEPSVPMSIEEAEAFWQQLHFLSHRDIASSEPMQGAWIVGQHGNVPFAIILDPEQRMELRALRAHRALRALPKFPYMAGRHSLVETLRSNNPSGTRDLSTWHGTAQQLEATLRAFFMHHATQPLPVQKPTETYDASKRVLRSGSAESVANDAFHKAIKAAKPSDRSAFADRWARAALSHVMDAGTDLGVLTSGGAERLDLLRVCNVHRTRHDLVAQARVMNRMFEVDDQAVQWRAPIQAEVPYYDAQRASNAAFRQAHALAMHGKPVYPGAFSQRLIKGLILAKASEARLVIGGLFETVTPALAACYGKAWPFMQAVEVVAFGRSSPELKVRKDIQQSAGTFNILAPDGAILDPPRVLLMADQALLKPCVIFHEFQHARQHTAAEGLIDDFQPQESHAAEVTESQAKQAEAHFIGKFGILY